MIAIWHQNLTMLLHSLNPSLSILIQRSVELRYLRYVVCKTSLRSLSNFIITFNVMKIILIYVTRLQHIYEIEAIKAVKGIIRIRYLN